MPIKRSETSLKLIGEDEAVCWTSSLHVSHPKIKLRRIMTNKMATGPIINEAAVSSVTPVTISELETQ